MLTQNVLKTATGGKNTAEFHINDVIFPEATPSTQDTYNFPTLWSDALSPEEFLEINCTLFNGTCIGLLNNTQINGTSNGTLLEATGEPLTDIILMGILSVLLGLMILVTVIEQ
ncbi:uncharacterized protein LOC116176160 [Photinus pyralis]|uniref:uncharacterized protein LOC116176160 n=1 Tax=Photinus pyralis TaxID=7054 RepID=UPI0012671024|nr:uncharacterized protein LOC116176160 [Photinus pyralis]